MAGRIEAVVWDVGRVLVEWDLRALYRRHIADAAQLEWFVTHVVTESWHAQHDAGADIFAMVAQRSAEFPDYADLIALYPDNFNQTIPGPVPGTHALVEALAAAGMPQYAITNFGAYVWQRFRPTQPVLNHMRAVVVSGEERLAKPDPAIFHLAQARFGHPASAMLFIDDNAANIAAAKDCGWQVHHFAGAEALAEDLRARGLPG